MKKPIWLLFMLCFILTIGLTACQNTSNFNIRFDSEGTVLHTISTGGMETLTLPDAPEKDGFIFDGWYTDKNDWTDEFTESYLQSKPLKFNMTVYAKWVTREPTTIRIIFNSNGGDIVADIVALPGASILEPDEPQKEHHTFGGWFLDEELSKPFFFESMPAANTTVYARWNPVKNKILLNEPDGTSLGFVEADYGTAVVEPDDPEKDGWVFDGWYADSDCTIPYNFTVMGENTTVYANLLEITHGMEYTISDDGNSYVLTGIGSAAGETEIVIPSDIDGIPIVAIGENALSNKGLISVYVSQNIEVLGQYALSNNADLAIVKFGRNSILKRIENYAFSYFKELDNLKLPHSLEFFSFSAIDGTAYANPDRWHDGIIYVDKWAVAAYGEKLGEHLTFRSDTVGIGTNIVGVLHGDKIKSVVIPASVKHINDGAFYMTKNLDSVTFEAGSALETIGEKAFASTGIKEIDLPETLRSIDIRAFANNDNLERVNFGQNSALESIGNYAFSECTSLTEIYLPANVCETSQADFYGMASIFEGCATLENIFVDERNTYLCDIDGVLYDYEMTTLLAYPMGKTDTTYTVVANVETIGVNAFYKNKYLTAVELPQGLRRVENEAFAYCVSLTRLELPSSIEYLGTGILYGVIPDDGIKVYIYATEPPETPSGYPVNNEWWKQARVRIYVPHGSIEAYKAAWSYHVDRIFAM